jgi:hypothetical protein
MPGEDKQTPETGAGGEAGASGQEPVRKRPYRKPELTALPLAETLGGSRRRDKENPVFFIVS